MKTNITQRLIAAGASPERARAFETQFKTQTSAFGIKKPQDIQDAFDEEIAAFSAAKYSNTFKPPKLDDPRIDSYIQALYGAGKLGELEKSVYTKTAPTYFKLKNSLEKNSDSSTWNLEQTIVKALEDGQTPALIAQNLIINRDDLWDGFTEGKVIEFVNSLSNEKDAFNAQFPVAKENLLMKDKYYKVGLPDPKLEYGLTEDLSKGIIDFRSHPSITKILKTDGVRAKQLSKTAPAGYIGAAGPESAAAFGKMKEDSINFESNLLFNLKGTKATPFLDEVKRRESLKKQTTIKPK